MFFAKKQIKRKKVINKKTNTIKQYTTTVLYFQREDQRTQNLNDDDDDDELSASVGRKLDMTTAIVSTIRANECNLAAKLDQIMADIETIRNQA